MNETSALKLFTVANFYVINSGDNTLLPCYTIHPTQHNSLYKTYSIYSLDFKEFMLQFFLPYHHLYNTLANFSSAEFFWTDTPKTFTCETSLAGASIQTWAAITRVLNSSKYKIKHVPL